MEGSRKEQVLEGQERNKLSRNFTLWVWRQVAVCVCDVKSQDIKVSEVMFVL